MKCKLSTLMGERRCTIEQLHKETGIARGTISSLYHDKTQRYDSDVVERLCNFFNCEISDLLELENKKSTKEDNK